MMNVRIHHDQPINDDLNQYGYNDGVYDEVEDIQPPPAPEYRQLRANTHSYHVMTDHIQPRHRNVQVGYEPSGWNSSTQISRNTTNPLKHQILCRKFDPPASVTVNPTQTTNLVERLSKETISSRMRGAQTSRATGLIPSRKTVDVNRKRYHLEQRKQTRANTKHPVPVSKEHDSIQMLLFYRREVEKRLRSDPTYLIHDEN